MLTAKRLWLLLQCGAVARQVTAVAETKVLVTWALLKSLLAPALELGSTEEGEAGDHLGEHS